ncbi:MAG: hypothetical protein ACRDRL_00340 [Sciscionella sp.]
MSLTPEQATIDALLALKAAGFGKEHKRPAKAASWNWGRSMDVGPYRIATEVTIKRAHLDDAIVALITLPGAIAYGHTATTVVIHRARD